jgi:hypothetical protein
MKLPKWISCKTCEWKETKILCSECFLKNKKSKLNSIMLYWKNEKINDTIRDICKENGWTEFDNDIMAKNLIERNAL